MKLLWCRCALHKMTCDPSKHMSVGQTVQEQSEYETVESQQMDLFLRRSSSHSLPFFLILCLRYISLGLRKKIQIKNMIYRRWKNVVSLLDFSWSSSCKLQHDDAMDGWEITRIWEMRLAKTWRTSEEQVSSGRFNKSSIPDCSRQSLDKKSPLTHSSKI